MRTEQSDRFWKHYCSQHMATFTHGSYQSTAVKEPRRWSEIRRGEVMFGCTLRSSLYWQYHQFWKATTPVPACLMYRDHKHTMTFILFPHNPVVYSWQSYHPVNSAVGIYAQRASTIIFNTAISGLVDITDVYRSLMADLGAVFAHAWPVTSVSSLRWR